MKRVYRKLLIFGLTAALLLAAAGAAAAAPAGTGPDKAPAPAVVPAFGDVGAEDPNVLFINYLAKRNIIKGFPDGTYHPGAGLTRAEAAALLARAAGLSPGAGPSRFSDVGGHWAAGVIGAATSAGLLSGYPDGTFRPDNQITRAEGISLVLRLSKKPDPGVALPPLEDLGRDHWAARPAAIGLAAGMAGLTADKRRFLPDAPLSRGDLARALGVLLTRDPDLSRTALTGTLKIIKGAAYITRPGSGPAEKIDSSAVAGPGDVIRTGSGSMAELVFPDGTGMLLEENTGLTVKEIRGRSYIKPDGSPGTAVDWLLVGMDKGQMFGTLATTHRGAAAGSQAAGGRTGSAGVKGYPLLAARDLWDMKGLLLAVEDQQPQPGSDQPWWQVAQEERVKVQVDMPWGVAGIKGSTWRIALAPDGRASVSMLEGSGSVTASGVTENLGNRQVIEIPYGAQPGRAAPMTSQEIKEFVREQVQNWLQERARDMQTNQELALHVDEKVVPREIIEEINRTIIEAVRDSVPSRSSSRNENPPADTTPPQISITDPADKATGVAVGKTITVIFSEVVRDFSCIYLKAGETVVSYTYELNGSILSINPVSDLDYNTLYSVLIPAGAVKDAAGNVLASDYAFSFTTAAPPETPDATPPQVSSTDPAGGATGVAVDKTITVIFSEDVRDFSCIYLKAGETVLSYTYELNDNILSIDPVSNLDYSTLYSVLIPAGAVKDMADNALTADYTFSFTTMSTGWETETISSAVYAGGASVAVDVEDIPHVAYYDSNQQKLKYAYRDGSSWTSPQVVDGGLYPTGLYPSLAVDQSGRPHISYYTATFGLYYAYRDISGWHTGTVDAMGESSSLVLDVSGHPHISYYDSVNNDLKYAYFNGTTWNKETVVSTVYDVGQYNSIALDSNGRPHISYYDSDNGDLKYAYFNGSAWIIQTVDDGGIKDVGQYNSIALDSNGRPHISYYDSDNGDLKYAYYNGSSWIIEVVDGQDFVDDEIEEDAGMYSTLALDSAGRPCISYFLIEGETGGRLKFAHKDSQWHDYTVDGGGLNMVGLYTSMALDEGDNPHIIYYDVINNALKYATWRSE